MFWTSVGLADTRFKFLSNMIFCHDLIIWGELNFVINIIIFIMLSQIILERVTIICLIFKYLVWNRSIILYPNRVFSQDAAYFSIFICCQYFVTFLYQFQLQKLSIKSSLLSPVFNYQRKEYIYICLEPIFSHIFLNSYSDLLPFNELGIQWLL